MTSFSNNRRLEPIVLSPRDDIAYQAYLISPNGTYVLASEDPSQQRDSQFVDQDYGVFSDDLPYGQGLTSEEEVNKLWSQYFGEEELPDLRSDEPDNDFIYPFGFNTQSGSSIEKSDDQPRTNVAPRDTDKEEPKQLTPEPAADVDFESMDNESILAYVNSLTNNLKIT